MNVHTLAALCGVWALNLAVVGSSAHAGSATSTAQSAAQTTQEGVLLPWDGEEEVELYSAVLTAASCAVALAEGADPSLVTFCSPADAVTGRFALFDPAEQQVYLLQLGSIYRFQLEQGFGGSMDIFGMVVGVRDGLPVIKPEEYSITPKPKPGAFKGCL